MPRVIGIAREALGGTMELLKNTNHDFSGASTAKGQTVSIGIPAKLSAGSISAANTAPAPTAVSNGYSTLTVDQFYKTSFAYTPREGREYELDSLFVEQVKEAIIGLAYKVNATLWERYYQIPYYVGNTGTALFYTGTAYSTDNLAAIDKALTDNYCPLGNRKLILTTSDYRDLLRCDDLKHANLFGSDQVVRAGVIPDVMGFGTYRDQQVPSHTKGAGITSDPVVSAAVAGTTALTITCDSGDACVFEQGDIITFGDGYNYAVQADVSLGNSEAGTLTVDRGLEAALAGTENPAFVTALDANSKQNIAGDLKGISVVARTTPTEALGYAAQGTHFPIMDPVSGFPMLLSVYGQYHQVAFEVSALWGVNVTDSRRLVRCFTSASY